MEEKYRLMMIADPGVIAKTWGHYIEGMESVLKYSHGESSLSNVYQKLIRGELTLWVGFMGKKYIGFYTTNYTDVPQGKKILTIVHAYMRPGTPRDAYAFGLQHIEEVAVKYSCDIIRFWTIRTKGFEKRMEKQGYKPTFVEFAKELGGEADG
ncbi:hypothetical protein LCGC14_0467150 [marine sediment metagenome]|uniref:N-acetyltransferase domain-containing protein n=1 Tax=marine sediment metagenome TaxID=412755 RepID=A0A0F9SW62_9ZZZZ